MRKKLNNGSIKIEDYRGFEIFYHVEDNVFYSTLQERYDLKKEPKRQSVIDTRKVIDEYIKKNANFVPFEALKGSCLGYGDERKRILNGVPTKIKILGIKKDGGLMCEHLSKDYNGLYKTFQLNNTSFDDERKSLFNIDDNTDLILATVAVKNLHIDDLKKDISKELAKIKPLDLSFIEDLVGKESLK